MGCTLLKESKSAKKRRPRRASRHEPRHQSTAAPGATAPAAPCNPASTTEQVKAAVEPGAAEEQKLRSAGKEAQQAEEMTVTDEKSISDADAKKKEEANMGTATGGLDQNQGHKPFFGVTANQAGQQTGSKENHTTTTADKTDQNTKKTAAKNKKKPVPVAPPSLPPCSGGVPYATPEEMERAAAAIAAVARRPKAATEGRGRWSAWEHNNNNNYQE